MNQSCSKFMLFNFWIGEWNTVPSSLNSFRLQVNSFKLLLVLCKRFFFLSHTWLFCFHFTSVVLGFWHFVCEFHRPVHFYSFMWRISFASKCWKHTKAWMEAAPRIPIATVDIFHWNNVLEKHNYEKADHQTCLKYKWLFCLRSDATKATLLM